MDRLTERCPDFATNVQECAKKLIMTEHSRLSDLAHNAKIEDVSFDILRKQRDIMSRLPLNLDVRRSKMYPEKLIVTPKKQFSDHICSIHINCAKERPTIACFVDKKSMKRVEIDAAGMDKFVHHIDNVIKTLRGHDMSYIRDDREINR